MFPVRRLSVEDVPALVTRVGESLRRDAFENPLICGDLDDSALGASFTSARGDTWVATRESEVVGHLYAALLPDASGTLAAWTGPDGWSSDSARVLAALDDVARRAWREAGATQHFVWVTPTHLDWWRERGGEPLLQRSALLLAERNEAVLPATYRLRRGDAQDVENYLHLSREIDFANGDPEAPLEHEREEFHNLIDDPDVRLAMLDVDGHAVGQCLWYPLEPTRGNFRATVHLSSVAIDPHYRGRGLATALIDQVLATAHREGFTHAETNWRVSNESAARFWTRYGFRPTYVRAGRPLID